MRRSKRKKKEPERLQVGFLAKLIRGFMSDEKKEEESIAMESLNTNDYTKYYKGEKLPTNDVESQIYHQEVISLNCDGSLNEVNPLSFLGATQDNESYTFRKFINQPDSGEFIKAMTKEIHDHTTNQHWKLVPRNSIGKAKTIPAIWSFKRKRRPDGTLLKHKARLCIHGGRQVYGENYWETYSPVVNWMSIRTLMVVALIEKLHTRRIDFVLAYPQADLDVDIYMEIPQGFGNNMKKDWVLKILKNLYGLKQAGYNWFEFLKAGLEKRDFVQSKIDICVWFREEMVVLATVNSH